jgi:hypothetical protein
MCFGFELDRRLRTVGSTVLRVVAHPGGALDSLAPSRPPVGARSSDVDSIGPGEAVKPVCPALAEGPELP